MITTKDDSIAVQSNVQGQHVALSIDVTAMAYIMDSLTNLYSDPEYAIIREYATNAYDSHVEAGNSAPIEVTLPSDLAPFLTIRDYGVGLDADDIVNIYSLYGASTKRNTNDQVGMLGFGCKSALAYTSSFTLVGIKDGERTVVNISREEDGAGGMTIVDRGPTDQPNGVEVKIPIKKYNNIAEKANNFFRFWQPGTVLVDGYAPKFVTGLKVTDRILIAEDMDYDDYVVMGNVPYPVDFERSIHDRDRGIVSFVNIGDVEFVPAREALKYTPHTEKTLTALRKEYDDNIVAAVEKTIAEADSFAAAFRMAYQWRTTLGYNVKVNFKGNPIPDTLKAEDGHRFIVTASDSYKLSSHNSVASVGANALVNGLIVHGYDCANFTPSHKKKLLKYCEDNDITTSHFILTDPKPKDQWIDQSRVISWDDVKVIKLEVIRTVRNANRPKGSYDVYVNGEYVEGLEADKIDTTKPICFVNTTSYGKDTFYSTGFMFKRLELEGTVVALPRNRVDKFLRDFPMTAHARDILQVKYDELSAGVTDADRKAAVVKNEYMVERAISHLDFDRINDPDVKALAALQNHEFSDAYKKVNGLFDRRTCRVIGVTYAEIEIEDKFVNPLEKYVLLRLNYSRPDKQEREHIYAYMNGLYAQMNAMHFKKSILDQEAALDKPLDD